MAASGEPVTQVPIQTRRLCKRYEDGLDALIGLDLEVQRGTIYCLLGANGAGKTTALNLLMSFIPPTSGDALINGISVVDDPLSARQHVAYLAENVLLYAGMTALQNLEFFCELCGRYGLGRDTAEALLDQVGLVPEALDRKVRDLSKGMRQKLGLAICMAKGCNAFILDEPMSGLDPEASQRMVEVLGCLRSQDRTILMSTHDIFRARQLADRVGILKGGRMIRELDRPELASADLAALYLDLMRGHSGGRTFQGLGTGEPEAGTA
jgi:ABC-2 type transport system ATP-binding protein